MPAHLYACVCGWRSESAALPDVNADKHQRLLQVRTLSAAYHLWKLSPACILQLRKALDDDVIRHYYNCQ